MKEGLIAIGMDPEEAAHVVRGHELAEEFLAKDPSLGPITSLIMGADAAQAERATRLVQSGAYTPGNALALIGSYARVRWALDHLPPEELYAQLPELWRGSDPDDTDPDFLEMWQRAKEWNGGQYLTDWDEDRSHWKPERKRPAPLPTRGPFKVYRGQDIGAMVGIAWSRSKEVAERFAHGAALRQRNRAGIIYEGRIRTKDVLGYMVGRHEEEVILNPADLWV